MACWMNRSSTVGMPSSRTPPPLFGICLPLHRLRLVASPRAVASRMRGQCSRQVRRQLVHRHPVDAGTALVLPHSLQRRLERCWRSTTSSIRRARFLSARFRSSPSALRRSADRSGLHPYPPAGAPACPDFWRLAPPRLTVVSLSPPFGPSLVELAPASYDLLLGYYDLC